MVHNSATSTGSRQDAGDTDGYVLRVPQLDALHGRPCDTRPVRKPLLTLSAAGVLMVYTSASSQHAITWLVAERGFAYSRAALVDSIGGGLRATTCRNQNRSPSSSSTASISASRRTR